MVAKGSPTPLVWVQILVPLPNYKEACMIIYGDGALYRLDKRAIDKVIFEGECCVIIDTYGNRFISRPEKGDKFDKEKGFLIALAKYNGFTTTKIQKIMEGAIVKNAKTKHKKQKKHN